MVEFSIEYLFACTQLNSVKGCRETIQKNDLSGDLLLARNSVGGFEWVGLFETIQTATLAHILHFPILKC